MNGKLYLENGVSFKGKIFGVEGTSIGELVFNTAMTGYQEIMTDPSYAGQMVCMTYPLIGNYGTNAFFSESAGAFLKGFIVKDLSETPSNWLSEGSLENFMKEKGVHGISGIDTRKLTKIIRQVSGIKGLITSEDLSTEEMDQLLAAHSMPKDLVAQTSTPTIQILGAGNTGKKIAVLDMGCKASILKNLVERNCEVTVYPWNTSAEEILLKNPDAVLLSNGPGDPTDIPTVVKEVQKIVKQVPVFGICLGHQLLALTFGAKTYKLPFGHHGGNHGVKDLTSGRCYITSQNHEFAVDEESMAGTGLIPTMLNLNDHTIEGMAHDTLPVWSVQFHPEASPGPHDAQILFTEFLAKLG